GAREVEPEHLTARDFDRALYGVAKLVSELLVLRKVAADDCERRHVAWRRNRGGGVVLDSRDDGIDVGLAGPRRLRASLRGDEAFQVRAIVRPLDRRDIRRGEPEIPGQPELGRLLHLIREMAARLPLRPQAGILVGDEHRRAALAKVGPERRAQRGLVYG